MGCGGSQHVQDVETYDACHVPRAFPLPPKNALPPDNITHEMYVQELNTYLKLVAKHPGAFRDTVKRRREIHFGDPWHTVAPPEVRMQPGQVQTKAEWDFVGP